MARHRLLIACHVKKRKEKKSNKKNKIRLNGGITLKGENMYVPDVILHPLQSGLLAVDPVDSVDSSRCDKRAVRYERCALRVGDLPGTTSIRVRP
jgi:hypothetical protein